LLKGFWFEEPGTKAKAMATTATASEILSLPLQVLLLNQQPLNKMLAGAAVIAPQLARAPGGRAAAPDVSASKGNCFLTVTTHADRRSSAFLPTL
jgi:hypothetical protein